MTSPAARPQLRALGRSVAASRPSAPPFPARAGEGRLQHQARQVLLLHQQRVLRVQNAGDVREGQLASGRGS